MTATLERSTRSTRSAADGSPALTPGDGGGAGRRSRRRRSGSAPRLWPAYTLVALVAALVANTWFRAGTFIATGDTGPFIRRGWQPEYLWSWGHAITGAGSATYVIARWPEFVVIDAVHAIGGSDMLAQRVFFTLIVVFTALSVAAFAARFTQDRVAIVVAGTFGICNGFFLTRLPNQLNVISVGVCALTAAIILGAAQGRRVRGPVLALAVLPMSFLTYNPPMFIVAVVWTGLGAPVVAVLLEGRRAIPRVLSLFARSAPWALLLNLFWLVPFAQAFTGGGGAATTAQTDPTAWAWAQAQNTVPNVLTLTANWAWFKPQYLPFTPALDQPVWTWVKFLLPLTMFLAPVLAPRRLRRSALTLLALVLGVTILAKGLVAPLSGFNRTLYKVVPGFWLFREPMSKLGQLLVPFGAALIAIAITGARRRIPRLRASWRGAAMFAAVGAVVLTLAYPYPLFTGAVIPDKRPLQPSAHVRVPAYWRTTTAAIDADPNPGKVLVLPLDDYYQMPTTWGFSGVDSIASLLSQHPVLQRHPDGYFGDAATVAAQIDAVEQALLAGDTAAVPPLLQNLGVASVIVRHDLLRGQPGRTFADDRVLAQAIARVPGLARSQAGTLEVWRVAGGTTDPVHVYGTPQAVTGEPAGIAATVASPGGAAVIGDAKTTAKTKVTATSPRPAGATASTDGVYWPVEAVDSGQPSTTFTSTGGTFSVAQRARAGAVLVPREVADPSSPSGSSLQLDDPTAILLDGAVVSTRPSATYPLAAGGVAVVQAGNRAVSLDGWSAGGLPAGSSGAQATVPSVVVGAATDLRAYRVGNPVTVSSYSSAYDCNNYEPRPIAELGLNAVVHTDAGTPVLQVSARDHAACSRVSVKGAAASASYRVRFEYRGVTGKRPAVCLYAVGPDVCIPGARLQAGSDWHRFEDVITLPAGATGLEVVLYANVGVRLSPQTVAEYRGVTVDALDPVLATTAWPEAVPATTVAVAPGPHTLSVSGGQYGSVLAPFEGVDDCFRYDDRSPDQVGIAATPLDGEPGAAFELRAKDHMACIGATAPDFGGASLYSLRYDYQSVALRKAKVCLYQRGPDACATLPANGPETTWTSFATPVTPGNVLETRLYLYGMRDLAGKQQSIVRYRNVGLVPYATPSAVVLTRTDAASVASVASVAPATPAGSSTAVRTERVTPVRYHVQAATVADGGVVGLTETYAPGWSLTGLPAGATARHVQLSGSQNGWVIAGLHGRPLDVHLTYAPAVTSRKALKISLLTVPLMLAFLVAGFVWRRRRTRRAARAAS